MIVPRLSLPVPRTELCDPVDQLEEFLFDGSSGGQLTFHLVVKFGISQSDRDFVEPLLQGAEHVRWRGVGVPRTHKTTVR